MNLRKEEFEKLQIEYNDIDDTYSKLFYITNLDAIEQDVLPEFCVDLMDYSSKKLDLLEGDTIEIRFTDLETNECGSFITDIGIFEIKNTRNGLLHTCKIDLERFVELYYRHFDEFDDFIPGEFDPEEKIFYKYVATSIGYELKYEYHVPANIKVHYRMSFNEEEVKKYIEGCKKLKDEEKALEYLYNDNCIYDKTEEFKKSDILLLYSDFALKEIYKNLDEVKDILGHYDLEMKGLFYPKCDFEVSIDCHGDIVEEYMVEKFGKAKGLYIVIGTDSPYYDADDMLNAAMEIDEAFGIKPEIYAGLSLIARDTKEELREDIDYKFIKDIDKAKMLFKDIDKEPRRYKANYFRGIDIYGFQIRPKEEFESIIEMYTHRIEKDLCNVYLEFINDITFERTLRCYTVNTSDFTKDEFAYMAAVVGEYDEPVTFEEIRRFYVDVYDQDEYNAVVALYSVLVDKIEYNQSANLEKYIDLNELNNKLSRNISYKVVSNKILKGKDRDIFENEPLSKRVKFTRNEIVELLSNK